MIKTFLYSMFAVFLFALGAAGSWFYLRLEAESEIAAAEEPPAAAIPTMPVGASALVAPATELGGEEMPVPVPAKPISAEEIFRYGAMNRERQEQLLQREKQVEKDELRLQLTHDDMQATQREIDGSLKQFEDMLARGDTLLSEIQQASDRLATAQAEFDKQSELLQEQTVGGDSKASLKVAAEWIQEMKPEVAARTILDLANAGKLDFALNLLRKVEGRDASKILDALASEDQKLVAELTERLIQSTGGAVKTRR